VAVTARRWTPTASPVVMGVTSLVLPAAALAARSMLGAAAAVAVADLTVAAGAALVAVRPTVVVLLSGARIASTMVWNDSGFSSNFSLRNVADTL